ncbi:MAG: cytochrome c [Thermoleophilia bacterium]|nr:cytochrome c [Thermoleophilia bacterium]
MRKTKKTAALLAIMAIAGTGALAGCNDSKGADASTPAGSETMANTAVQTDQDGKTSTASVDTTAAPAGTDTAASTDAGASGGDAAAGKTLFEGTCQGCHPNGGNDAGVGPKLAGVAGLDAALVKDRIVNGKGAMPPGLVTDPTDEANVIAYVMSLQ